MGKRLDIHPTHPQGRLIQQVAEVVASGGTIIYPTDSLYAFGCRLDAVEAQDHIRIARHAGKSHFFTLVCRDLAELSRYARVDNTQFRLIKSLTPGPYTFILQATRELPRRLQDPKRKSIGLRIPNHPVTQALIDALGTPLLSTTVSIGEETLFDIEEIDDRCRTMVDLLVACGPCGVQETTVIDCLHDKPELIRRGAGPVEDILELD